MDHRLFNDGVETFFVLVLRNNGFNLFHEDLRRNGGHGLIAGYLLSALDPPLQVISVCHHSAELGNKVIQILILLQILNGHHFFLAAGQQPSVVDLKVHEKSSSLGDLVQPAEGEEELCSVDGLEGDEVRVFD